MKNTLYKVLPATDKDMLAVGMKHQVFRLQQGKVVPVHFNDKSTATKMARVYASGEALRKIRDGK